MAKKQSSFLNRYKTYNTSEGFGNAEEWQQAFHSRMTGEEAEEILKQTSEDKNDEILFKRRPNFWDRTEMETRSRIILGVTEDTTHEEIKKKYWSLMKKWHEDSNPGNEEKARTMSQKITAAYTILASP
jgi:hypothetical protein